MIERIDRQKQILLQLLEEGKHLKAEDFKVSNQNEPLKFLENKGLITRYWNDSKKKNFKWNYIAKSQMKKVRKFLGLNSLSNENKKG